MLSGKDERPLLKFLPGCDRTSKCENQSIEGMYYEIFNGENSVIGYINTRLPMEAGTYNSALEINPKYKDYPEIFEAEIKIIRCQKCQTIYGKDYANVPQYEKFRKYIKYQLKNELHGFDYEMT